MNIRELKALLNQYDDSMNVHFVISGDHYTIDYSKQYKDSLELSGNSMPSIVEFFEECENIEEMKSSFDNYTKNYRKSDALYCISILSNRRNSIAKEFLETYKDDSQQTEFMKEVTLHDPKAFGSISIRDTYPKDSDPMFVDVKSIGRVISYGSRVYSAEIDIRNKIAVTNAMLRGIRIFNLTDVDILYIKELILNAI
jgi:hypothetical protein